MTKATSSKGAGLSELFTPGEEAMFEWAKIEHEDEVLNHRLSWLTTSQAIFVTAYVLRFSRESEMPGPIRVALPVLALYTCALFFVGIRAAVSASKLIERGWDERHPHHEKALRTRRASHMGCQPNPGQTQLIWKRCFLPATIAAGAGVALHVVAVSRPEGGEGWLALLAGVAVLSIAAVGFGRWSRPILGVQD